MDGSTDWAAREDDKALFVLGPPGIGKSSLIARFVEDRRQARPRDFVFEHYIGASLESADSPKIAERLLDEIKRAIGADEEAHASKRTDRARAAWHGLRREIERYNDGEKKPSEKAQLTAAEIRFRLEQLNTYAEHQNITAVVAIDGLDKIYEPAFDFSSFWWAYLAKQPPRVKLLISCIDKGALRGYVDPWIQGEEFDRLVVGHVPVADRAAIISVSLSAWGKKISAQRSAPILGHALSGLPMFLQLVLAELRLSSVEAGLEQHLSRYMRAQDIPNLYANILERLEGDCGVDAVRRALSCVWASRTGLEASEITAIARITPLTWATVRTALGPGLGELQGRTTVGDRFLSDAIVHRYVESSGYQKGARTRLAEYFIKVLFRDPKAIEERPIEELLFQLRRAEEWPALMAMISSPWVFAFYGTRKPTELSGYLAIFPNGFDPAPKLAATLREIDALDAAEAARLSKDIATFYSTRMGSLEALYFDAEGWKTSHS
jgi:nephrocystin-3